MDGFKEKKWFVYLGDHHEGPFSLEEIQTKISGGQLTATNYVWADGMADWKMMTEVAVFEPVIKNAQNEQAPPPPPPDATSAGFTISPAVENNFAASTTSLAPELATAVAYSLEPAPAPEAALTLEAYPTFETTPSLEAAPAVTEAAPSVSFEIPTEAVPTGEPSLSFQAALQPVLEGAGPAIHLEAANLSPRRRTDPYQSPTASSFAPSASSTSGGQSRSSSIMKWAGYAAIFAGLFVAYTGGFFSPIVNSQVTKAGVQTAQNFLDPVLAIIADKVPILGQWISPLPALDDVSKEEYEQLKAAANGNLNGTGPQLGMALSQADLFSPSFYLATNLPDGATFAVYVDGIPDTLLNQLSFSAVGQATVTKHLAKVDQLKSADGKAFPRGKFTVYIIAPDSQPPAVKPFISRFMAINAQSLPFPLPQNSRVVMTKGYFLGGPRDATYTTRLKEFHDKITARAQAELVECKQFTSLLEAQLTGTNTKFAALKRGKRVSAGQKKTWGDFHKQWSTLSDQIGQAFAKMTPETLHNDYFYGSIYLASQQASQAAARLHDIQNTFFTTNSDPKSFDIQLGEAASVAQSALNELKAKIDRIEKLPPNPNGMPVRDSL
jgi:GYF domain 2